MSRFVAHTAIAAVLVLAWPLTAHAATADDPLSPAEVVVLNPEMDGSTNMGWAVCRGKSCRVSLSAMSRV